MAMYVYHHIHSWSCTWWSCSYVIMYIHDHIRTKLLQCKLRLRHSRFGLHSGRATAASVLAQWVPHWLLRMLSLHLSSFRSCLVSASVTSTHAQCMPKRLPHTLKVQQSFRKFQGRASEYTEYAPKPLYHMLRAWRSCFSVLSEGTSVASAHAQSAPQLCNSPIVAEWKIIWKNIHFLIGKYNLKRNIKLPTKKCSFLCTFNLARKKGGLEGVSRLSQLQNFKSKFVNTSHFCF